MGLNVCWEAQEEEGKKDSMLKRRLYPPTQTGLGVFRCQLRILWHFAERIGDRPC